VKPPEIFSSFDIAVGYCREEKSVKLSSSLVFLSLNSQSVAWLFVAKKQAPSVPIEKKNPKGLVLLSKVVASNKGK
jgi:hypothetical protein